MPAKSRKQQMAAGAALSAQRGKRTKGSLKGASRQMADSMSENQLEELASTQRKKLPARARGTVEKSAKKAAKKTSKKKSSKKR